MSANLEELKLKLAKALMRSRTLIREFESAKSSKAALESALGSAKCCLAVAETEYNRVKTQSPGSRLVTIAFLARKSAKSSVDQLEAQGGALHRGFDRHLSENACRSRDMALGEIEILQSEINLTSRFQN